MLNVSDASGNKDRVEVPTGSIETLSDGVEISVGDHTVRFHTSTETNPGNREDSSRATVSYSNPQLQDKSKCVVGCFGLFFWKLLSSFC